MALDAPLIGPNAPLIGLGDFFVPFSILPICAVIQKSGLALKILKFEAPCYLEPPLEMFSWHLLTSTNTVKVWTHNSNFLCTSHFHLAAQGGGGGGGLTP